VGRAGDDGSSPGSSRCDRLSGKHRIKDVASWTRWSSRSAAAAITRDQARRLFPSTDQKAARPAPYTVRGTPRDRARIRELLDELLPTSPLAMGNGDMLAEVATDEREPGEALVLLYPCRSTRPTGGSAVLIVTDRDVVLVELVGNGVAGSRRRRPRSAVRQVPLEPRRSLHVRKAALTIRWSDGTEWHCRSLRREQATAVADLLRPSG
jgi:hypothetical protein